MGDDAEAAVVETESPSSRERDFFLGGEDVDLAGRRRKCGLLCPPHESAYRVAIRKTVLFYFLLLPVPAVALLSGGAADDGRDW
jgi:hypothetical protein